MKKIMTIIAVLLTTLAATAQTLNIQVGSVTYQFPAASAGDMTYTDGTTLTIMGKAFTLSDITAMSVDNTEVTNNLVSIAYNGTSATVTVAGNVAQYVTPTVSGAYVSIAQSNTADVDDDEITYQLTGTSTDGQLSLSGSYKCTVSLAGVDLTCTTGSAINITNKKRIQISAKNGTENTLTDCSNGSQKGCIYSKGQIQLQGKGALTVVGNTKHAIKSGDYISVKNLTLNVTSAAADGISCNKYFLMKSGTVTISGIGDDGIQCDLEEDDDQTSETTDHEDENSGNIYIEDGTLTVTVPSTVSAGKCVKGAGDVIVSGGTTTVNAYGAIDLSDTTDPSYTAGLKAEGNITWSGGNITANVTGGAGRGLGCNGTFTAAADNTGTLTVTNSGATSSTSSYHCTAKGVKAGVVAINGGTINVTMSGASAKGIKSDSDDGSGDMTITGGTITVTTSGAGSYDQTESDAKGAGCLKADNNMTISGGTLTLKSTGSGGKGIKADNVLTITDGTISATTTGSKYSYSSSVTASPKAIKAGTKTASSSASNRAPGGGGGGNGPGGGGNNPGGGGDSGNYTYSGGMVISGGTITASSSNHEAIESKNTIEISGGYVYAYSSDDAINSASDFTITGGYVMGNSSGNDGLDANGNFYIKGGNVVAVATTSPEVGIDANTEGGYKLYITGGNVVAIGGLESGSSLSGVTSKSASYSKGSWYTFKNGSTTAFYFKAPSNSKQATTMTIVATSTPSISTASNITSNIWNGFGATN